MQLPIRFFGRLLTTLIACAVQIGCRPPLPVDVPKPQPFIGKTVRLACTDARYAQEFLGRGRIWGTRTGGTVLLEPDWTKADAAVIPPVRLGELAATGELTTRSDALANRDHPVRWMEVLPSFQDKLCNWGRTPVAVPLAGDGFALIYRIDRFADPKAIEAYRAKHQRNIVPPRAWEDLRVIAEAFHALDGKPSLPPLPSDPATAVATLNQIAACYDRQATTSERAAKAVTDDTPAPTSRVAFRFHTDPDTAAPRLTAPPFVAAFGWFHDTAKFRPATAGHPLESITTGTAVMAVLPLADIARLPKAPDGTVDKRFGIAPIPGTAVWFDAEGKPQQAIGGRNYVPYLGAGGQLGVVFKRTTVADAAWDFLADLSGPGGSDDTLGEVALGAGPFRYPHVAADGSAGKWQRYGFDAARSEELAKAMTAFADTPVREPVYPLRTPDQGERVKLLDVALRKAASGALAGDKAAAEAQEAWKAIDAKVPPMELLKQARSAVGLE